MRNAWGSAHRGSMLEGEDVKGVRWLGEGEKLTREKSLRDWTFSGALSGTEWRHPDAPWLPLLLLSLLQRCTVVAVIDEPSGPAGVAADTTNPDPPPTPLPTAAPVHTRYS